MDIDFGSTEIIPKLRNYMPYELESVPRFNDKGEIVGYDIPDHPFVSVADGILNGQLKVNVPAGTFSTADGIAEIATALSLSANTRTSGNCNFFGDDAAAMCAATSITAEMLAGSKVQTKIKK